MATGSNLHWVDYVVIVGYFALVIAVGIISSIKVFIIFIVMLILIFSDFQHHRITYLSSVLRQIILRPRNFTTKSVNQILQKQSQLIFSVFGVWYRIVYLVFGVCQLLLWYLSTWSFPVIPIFLIGQSKRDSVAGYFLASRNMHWIPVIIKWSWLWQQWEISTCQLWQWGTTPGSNNWFLICVTSDPGKVEKLFFCGIWWKVGKEMISVWIFR